MQARKALVMALVVLGTSAFLLPMMVSAARWSSPFALGGGDIHPSVAIDEGGNQHYVWRTSSGNIQYSRCTGLGGQGCSTPKNLPTAGVSYRPSIDIDPQGRPNVVFSTRLSTADHYAVYWTRKEGTNWSSAQRISSEPYAEVPDIAIGSDGKIHVIYQSKQNETIYIYYTTSDGGFEFSPTVELDTATSDKPLTEFGKLDDENRSPEKTESQLGNGAYPHIAVDQDNNAHAVWGLPSPYGVNYRYQSNGNFGNIITVANGGKKEQTPDITVAPNGSVGIVYTNYSNDTATFKEYNNGNLDNTIGDVDGGLAQSFWPRIAADCAGNFHFVFQGSANADQHWNIYHRTYNPPDNSMGNRETIANIDASEQTPVVDSTNVAAIVYTNTTNGIIDASTTNLNIQCTGNVTATPTEMPTVTNTPDPNVTPTATPTVGGEIWIPNTSNEIAYRKKWKKLNDRKATDNNYSRCEESSGACPKRAAAKILVPDGYTQVKWYTAKSKVNGIANVFINDQFVGKVDLCKGSSSNTQKFFNKTYTIPARIDGQPRSFEIGAPGKHSSCSPYNSNFVVIDGFRILP